MRQIDRDSLVCGAIGALMAFVLAWKFFYIMGSAPIKKVDASAWIQAAGSMLAVLAAVLVFYLQRRNDLTDRRSDERRVARSLGSLLYKDIRKWRERSGPLAPAQNPSITTRHLIPDRIYERMSELHTLGEAGDGLFHAIKWSLAARQMGDDPAHHSYMAPPGALAIVTPEQYRNYNHAAHEIRSGCDKALRAIDALLDMSV